ncbi:class I SAM-dependent methyltransferase [Acidobacteriota bacterium]
MVNQIADLFDLNYMQYDKWYDNNKNAYLSELEALKKVVPKKGNGLEIGVGTGRFAAPLGIKFGVDPSRSMIKLAKKKGVDTRLGFGESLPLPDAFFDYVAIINTLCFVKSPRKVIMESVRVLKNDGKLIVGIIDRDSFLGQAYQAKKSRFYKYANFFNVEELTDLTKGFGFNQVSFYQAIFQFPEKIQSIEEPREGFGTGGFVVATSEKISMTSLVNKAKG